jgi:outer membrane cobalamin receptor
LVLTNTETGFKRSVNLDSSGRFSLGALPVGSYSVQVLKDGKVVNSNPDVEVRIGQGTEISFADTVVVTGTQIAKKLDMTEMGSTTIFTAKELQRIPVANNVGAIIQLAPNTTSGDSRYGGSNAPSFGGSSASENAYYINGFPVTNSLTQVGFSQLPFNSIAQAQVLTGGYGAEFGRSTGGVVNIITKSGSNEFKAGGGMCTTRGIQPIQPPQQAISAVQSSRTSSSFISPVSEPTPISAVSAQAILRRPTQLLLQHSPPHGKKFRQRFQGLC